MKNTQQFSGEITRVKVAKKEIRLNFNATSLFTSIDLKLVKKKLAELRRKQHPIIYLETSTICAHPYASNPTGALMSK